MAVCYFVGLRTAVVHFVLLNPGQNVSTYILRWVAVTRVNLGTWFHTMRDCDLGSLDPGRSASVKGVLVLMGI